MRRYAFIVGLAVISLASGCAAPGRLSANYSCEPTFGPHAGEFYMFAPTVDAQGNSVCGAGHS